METANAENQGDANGMDYLSIHGLARKSAFDPATLPGDV